MQNKEIDKKEDKYREYTKIFKAFCDEKRLEIIGKLKNGEKCACILIDEIGIAQSALSYHMKILCDSEIIQSRQEGKWTYYSINNENINKASEILKTITEI